MLIVGSCRSSLAALVSPSVAEKLEMQIAMSPIARDPRFASWKAAHGKPEQRIMAARGGERPKIVKDEAAGDLRDEAQVEEWPAGDAHTEDEVEK